MFENHGRGIGQKGKDNGLLLCWPSTIAQVRAEVGYDLEGIITDGFAGRDQPRRDGAVLPARTTTAAGCSPARTRFAARIAEGRGVTLEGVPVRVAAAVGR